jgi:hypothetical protein
MNCHEKANNYLEPVPVKCNVCDWTGTENELCLSDDDKELCPNCHEGHGVMDLPKKK